jgi:hypothetical protein
MLNYQRVIIVFTSCDYHSSRYYVSVFILSLTNLKQTEIFGARAVAIHYQHLW